MRLPVNVVLSSITNSSRTGPTMEEPSGFFTTGTAMVNGFVVLFGATVGSQPLHTIVYPSRIRNPLPASAAVVGSFPPVTASFIIPNDRVPPRLLISKKPRWFPFEGSTGLRM